MSVNGPGAHVARVEREHGQLSLEDRMKHMEQLEKVDEELYRMTHNWSTTSIMLTLCLLCTSIILFQVIISWRAHRS
jgi:hypothetical protein